MPEVPGEIEGQFASEAARQRELEIAAKAERYSQIHSNDTPRGGLTQAIRRALRRVRRAKDSGS